MAEGLIESCLDARGGGGGGGGAGYLKIMKEEDRGVEAWKNGGWVE